MLRKSLALLAFASVGLASSAAFAQEPVAAAPASVVDGGIASAGNLIVSAERLFGFSVAEEKTDQTVGNTTVTRTDSQTSFGLLWNPGASTSPYLIPRVGIDYTVIDGLTVGGSLGFYTHSTSSKQEGGGQSREVDGPSLTALMFAPRVGYILQFGDNMGLWLRGGITYYNVSSESESDAAGGTGTVKTETSTSGLALSLDPAFVITPVKHFGFFAGAMIDFGLSGTAKSEQSSGGATTSQEVDQKFNNFGINFGLLGYL